MPRDKAKRASKKTAKKGTMICERVRVRGGGYKKVCKPKMPKIKGGGKTVKPKPKKEAGFSPKF